MGGDICALKGLEIDPGDAMDSRYQEVADRLRVIGDQMDRELAFRSRMYQIQNGLCKEGPHRTRRRRITPVLDRQRPDPEEASCGMKVSHPGENKCDSKVSRDDAAGCCNGDSTDNEPEALSPSNDHGEDPRVPPLWPHGIRQDVSRTKYGEDQRTVEHSGSIGTELIDTNNNNNNIPDCYSYSRTAHPRDSAVTGSLPAARSRILLSFPANLLTHCGLIWRFARSGFYFAGRIMANFVSIVKTFATNNRVFFCLNLITTCLIPVRNRPEVIGFGTRTAQILPTRAAKNRSGLNDPVRRHSHRSTADEEQEEQAKGSNSRESNQGVLQWKALSFR